MDKKPIARFCLHCEAYIEDLSLNVCPECGAELSYDAAERIHTLTQFEKNDYVGAVDPVTGLVYLPARYKELRFLPGNGIMTQVDDKWAVIKQDGSIGFRFDHINDDVYDDLYRTYDVSPYAVEADGKAGYVSEDGDLLIPCEFDYVLPYIDGLGEVCKGGKVMFLDKQGHQVDSTRKPTFVLTRPFRQVPDEESKTLAVDVRGDCYWMTRTGNATNISRHYRPSSWGLEKDGAYIDVDGDDDEYLCASDGSWISGPYISVDNLYEGRAAFTVIGYRVGFLDERGKEIIPSVYSRVSRFYGGKALVDDGSLYFIDRSGKQISESFDDDEIQRAEFKDWKLSEDPCFLHRDTDVIIKSDDQVQSSADDDLLFGVAPEREFDRLNSEKSFASRRLSDDRVELYGFEKGYIGTFEQLKYDNHYCSSYVSVRKNGKWGLADVNGCEVLPQIYDAWVTCIEDSLYDTGKVACLHDDSECFLYDLEGKKISDQAYCGCYSMAGLIYAETIEGDVDFFDFQGNLMDVTDKVQIGSEDFKSSIGRRLAVEIYKFSEEVCVDEDSGDVVTVERRDAVAAIGEIISDELIQELMSTENIQQYAYVWKEPVRGSDWQLWYRRIK